MQITEKTLIKLQVETPGGTTDSFRLSDLDQDFLMSFKRKGSSKSIKDILFLSRENSGNKLETLDDSPSSKKSKSKNLNGDLAKGQQSFDEGFRTNSNNHLRCPTDERSGSPSLSRLEQLQSGLDPAGSSSSSSTFSSRTSSSSLDGISRFRLLNRQLSCRIKKSWSFRKMEQLTKKVRSHSDVGVYEGIIDGASEGVFPTTAPGVEKNTLAPESSSSPRSARHRHHRTRHPTRDLARQSLMLTVGSPQQAPPRVVEDPPTDSDGSSDGHRTSSNLLIGGLLVPGPKVLTALKPTVVPATKVDLEIFSAILKRRRLRGSQILEERIDLRSLVLRTPSPLMTEDHTGSTLDADSKDLSSSFLKITDAISKGNMLIKSVTSATTRSFDGTLCHQTQGASDTNNNGQDKTKSSARKSLLALGRDSKRVLKRKELGPELTTVSEGKETDNCVKIPAPKMHREMKRSLSERPTEGGKKLSNNFRKTWSTGNFSAPVVSIGAPAPPAPRSAPASPLQPPVVPAPSPHHDKSGKQASWSGGEAGPGAPEAGGGAGPLPAPAPGSHKARQKKFHRHFPQASLEERVLNYYSCALVGDILLQGHLYITKNYFAFYSNVFGYVTKLLIPLSSVVRVSKEKMARIIPNAVGITTLEDKHVFASLLSRDTTYKLMMQVLKASPAPVIELSPSPQELRLTKGESEVSLDEDSSCCSQSGAEEGGRVAPVLTALPIAGLAAPHVRDRSRLRTPDIDAPVTGLVGVSTDFTRKPSIPVLLAGARATGRRRGLSATPLSPPVAPSPPPSAHSLLLLAATALLVVLFLSAGLLLYRIGKVGAPDGHIDDNVLMLKRGDDVYSQILKWHSQLHTKSAMQVHDFLHSNLDQIAKVRQSLETLSTLIGGIITDKMAPLDTRQGGYITRQGEPTSGESLRGNANS